MSQQAQTADQFEPPDEFDPIEESSMTLMEHLIELRTRLMWIGGSVIIATLIAMIFAWDIVEVLNRPLGDYIPQAIGPTDNLVVFFKVALAGGAALAMPVIMYQLIAFVTPGLYPHEKRALLMILPGAMFLFAVGVVFAFFVMLPPAVRFLQGFGGDRIRTEWTASLYIGFVTRITFWIGVAFQAPLVVAFLARIGLVSGPQLLRFWRQAIVFVAIAAAFITPTIDPVNMTIVMGPLIFLYFFSVGVAYLLYKPREPRDFSEGSFIPEEYRDDSKK
jgi:sec-independent protein translocase protein TatC